MKKTKFKHNDESGIAIMFSLIMLSIFFLIAFGFVSMATSAKSAAKAREPKQSSSLTASETTLNEALFSINKWLHDGNEVADSAKFEELDFINSGGARVTLNAWGTSSTDRITPNYEDRVLPQMTHSIDGEFKIDTADAEYSLFGWLTSGGNKYAWMVIDSNNIDANYLGISDVSAVPKFAIANNRLGKYARELDLKSLHSSYESVYVDWSGATPPVWESKKHLISTITSNYETVVSMLEVGTSPIIMKDVSSLFDIATIDNTTTLATVRDGISWLRDSATGLQDQIALNIKDYCDSDNIVSIDGNTIGNERVANLSEINFEITNGTNPAAGAGTPAITECTIKISAETINMYGTDVFTPISGSAAEIKFEGAIKISRNGEEINEDLSQAKYDLSLDAQAASTIVTIDTGDLSATGSSSETLPEITVNIEITSITLLGDGSEPWDKVLNVSALAPSNTIAATDTLSYNLQVIDPRVNSDLSNSTNWTNQWTTGTGSLTTVNTPAVPKSNIDTQDFDSTDITQLSTCRWRTTSTIASLDELGLVSRGIPWQTLNLVDYNMAAPTVLSANFKPTNTLDDLSDTSKFNGGDRSLLDYVRLSNAITSSTGESYNSYSLINPNSTNEKIFKLLFNNVSTIYQIEKSTVPSQTEIDKVISRFPSIAGNTQDKMFFVSDFHETTNNSNHNRNPKTYGYLFSRKHIDNVSGTPDALNDAEAESLLIKTMNLLSPKYSYYTVLTAVDESGTTTSLYAFVRRDNESGAFKVLKTIEKVTP